MVFSTQQFIDIAGMKNGVIIMKDGSYRLILQVNAVNFALKSEQEQNSIIFQFQSFLNSLHFPIEISIRSRRLDLTPYLNKISTIAQNQTNELTRIQAEDYIGFVAKLITIANIMKKSFYVAIQHNTINVKNTGLFDKFFSKNSQTFDHVKISDVEFKESTNKLTEKANIVANGLGGLGIHCQQLTTEEIIELFYSIYNPDESTKQRITDVSQIDAQVVGSETESPEAANAAADTSVVKIDNSEVVKAQLKFQAEQKANLNTGPLGAPATGAEAADSATEEDGIVPPAGEEAPKTAIPAVVQNESFSASTNVDGISSGGTTAAAPVATDTTQKTAADFPTINTQN
ncbi:MAG: hypothetical protein WCI57_03050 [Candidatus Berkelbacteria bacterium]